MFERTPGFSGLIISRLFGCQILEMTRSLLTIGFEISPPRFYGY